MRIFFITQSSKIEEIILKKNYPNSFDFKQVMTDLKNFGFSELFGICKHNKCLFDTVANSWYIQTKWASENNVSYGKSNWQNEILAAQIEKFQPDVIYTSSYDLLSSKNKEYLPKAKLYALWNASPIPDRVDLSHFDLGLSFNLKYRERLKKKGIKNVEHNTFYIDPKIKKRLEGLHLLKDIDISFVGRYDDMFKNRNQLLYDVSSAFKMNYNVQYYLLTAKRFRGLIPTFPWRLLSVYNKPVFLEDMFKIFFKSKIVLNTHSDITDDHKGNMRVFEILGSGSFMLSDNGIYPENLVDGKDFVLYKNKKDMLNKIQYYLNNEDERFEIANNGYKKITKYYNTQIGANNLVKIFSKYL
jgi:glycosyltransferase involved in cell wall biosynthesis